MDQNHQIMENQIKLTNQNQSGIENNYVRDPPRPDGDEDDTFTVEEGGSILGKGAFGTTYRMRNVLDNGISAVKRVNYQEVKLFVKDKKNGHIFN